MAKKVKIYSTPSCVYCRMAKEFFKKHDIEYEESDVASDLNARDEMMNISHQMGVPVIDIDGEIFVGFDQSALAKALDVKI